MKTRLRIVLILAALSVLHLAMARHGVYDEEAREAEKLGKAAAQSSSRNNPAKGIASGIRETVSSPKDVLTETADGTANETPVVGTLEGARVGSSKAVEQAAKGVMKVATLGYGDTDNMKIEEPQADSDDVGKFKIRW
ncbi:MAG: hypothetical protein ACOY3K_03960 [Candidatus Omnitrophota bacterium]